MEKPDLQKQTQQNFVVQLLRWAGFFLMVVSFVIFFDVGGLATAAQLTQGGIHQILGGMLFVMGVVDVVLIPRVFETVFHRDRK